MADQKRNITRLGIFVLAAFAVLLLSLFLIGKNQHLIGSHFTVRAHFRDVGGLRTGNNVRYAGIEVGTVSRMSIINDTTLEVTMLLNREMKQVIRKNALASLGADGLMGNKVVNIIPQESSAAYVEAGDLLPSRQAVEIDDVIRTLAGTGENIRVISEGLKETVAKINNSEGIWKLLSDKELATNIRRATGNLERATENADVMTRDMRQVIAEVKAGKGPLGTILKDTVMARELKHTVSQLETVALHAEKLAGELQTITLQVGNEIRDGKGPVNLALKDTAVAGNISRSLNNVEKGTYNFNQNMEALKQNFLFRGYFKKQEKARQKAASAQ